MSSGALGYTVSVASVSTRLRPPAFARYSALSAVRRSDDGSLPSTGIADTPKLAVIALGTPDTSTEASASRSYSATVTAL